MKTMLIKTLIALTALTLLSSCSSKNSNDGNGASATPNDCYDPHACGAGTNTPYYGSGSWTMNLNVINAQLFSEMIQLVQPIQCYAYPCVQPVMRVRVKMDLQAGYGRFNLRTTSDGYTWGQRIHLGGASYTTAGTFGFAVNYVHWSGYGGPTSAQPSFQIVAGFSDAWGSYGRSRIMYKNTVVAEGYFDGYLYDTYGFDGHYGGAGQPGYKPQAKP